MSGAGPTKVASAPKTVASEPASKMSSVKMEASATAAPAGNAAEPAANGGASAPTAADFSQWAAAAAMQQYYAGAKQATGAAQTGQQAAAYYAQMASNPGLYPQMWAGQAVRVPPPRPFESRVFFFPSPRRHGSRAAVKDPGATTEEAFSPRTRATRVLPRSSPSVADLLISPPSRPFLYLRLTKGWFPRLGRGFPVPLRRVQRRRVSRGGGGHRQAGCQGDGGCDRRCGEGGPRGCCGGHGPLGGRRAGAHGRRRPRAGRARAEASEA